MKILITGNGFDIAHNLPTKYSNFLDFVNNRNFYNNTNLKELYLSENIDEFKQKNKIIQYINSSLKDNWIDFETNLLEIITSVFGWQKHLTVKYSNANDSLLQNKKNTRLCLKENYTYDENSLNIQKLQFILLNFLCNGHFFGNNSLTFDQFSICDIYSLQDEIVNDFYLFKEIFTKYINVVNQMNIDKLDFFSNKSYDVIFTFNYTNTFERLYNNKSTIHYIHGNVKENNIVLGVGSDYFDKSYNETSYCFYKFFQRIINKTDNDYQKYIKGLNLDCNHPILIDIFGHSLDPTDEDILNPYIDKAHRINIYYINEEDRNAKIINLTKILGKDKLIKYTLSAESKINFIKINNV